MIKLYRLKRIYAFFVKSYYTLSGWRFHDLKEFIRLNQERQVSHNRADMLLSLDTALACRERTRVKNALLSAMPPADTGVATCNLKSLIEGGAEVDVFSSWDCIEDFAIFETLAGSAISGYSYSSLPLFSARRRYKNLVVSIGNSDHNLFAVMAMVRFNYQKVCSNVILHLHDGCLLNLAEKLLALQGKSLIDGVLSTYSDCDSDEIREFSATCTERWRLVEGLVTRGIYGLRIVIEMTRPSKVLTNSVFAAEMVSKDFGLQGCPIPVEVGFHPIFASDTRCIPYRRWARDLELRVGSFGIPSESKSTSLVVEACRELEKFGIKVKLVLAGYSVRTYADKNPHLFGEMNLEIHSDISDDQLLDVMDKVHVAVQLRKRNLGESSGVMASLLKKQVPTIATATGAFKEYQYSCMLVGEEITSSELAISILSLAQGDEIESFKRMQMDFTDKHSPEKLCNLLFS